MAKQSSRPAKDGPSNPEVMDFVTAQEQRLEQVDTACRAQQWLLYTQPDALRGTHGAPWACEQERAALLLNEDTWLALMGWVATLSPNDPAQRRLVLLGRRLMAAQVEAQPDVYPFQHELVADFLAHGPPWGQFLHTLHTNPDCGQREATWRSLYPLATAMKERFLELVRRRNRWAQQQGYPNYVDLMLTPHGLSRDSVLERYVELEEVTQPSYRAFVTRMRHLLQNERLAPWDVTYLLQARLSPGADRPGVVLNGASLVELIEALGLPWEPLPVTQTVSDRLPFFSLCWPVHIPDDIRLITPAQLGWEAYFELARAYGQALLAALTKQSTFLLRENVPCYQAGMGAFLARLAAEPAWLRRKRMLPESRLARIPQITLDLLGLRLRRLMALSVFEYQLYELPEADHDVAWGRTQEAFLGLPGEPSPLWAAQPDLILRPIHVQDEIIGELIASQAISYLYQRFGALFDNPEVTDFLMQSYYASGSTDDWVDKVRTATGKFLSNKALFGELVGEE